jgi:hypothetical protein
VLVVVDVAVVERDGDGPGGQRTAIVHALDHLVERDDGVALADEAELLANASVVAMRPRSRYSSVAASSAVTEW